MPDDFQVLPLDEEINNKLLNSLSLSDATAEDILSNNRVAAVLDSDFKSNKTRLINGVYKFALLASGSREHPEDYFTAVLYKLITVGILGAETFVELDV